MERLLDGWRRLDDVLAVVEKVLVVVAATVMVGAVFSQSMLRFFFEKNLFGANEVATLLLVWVGFLSASLATRARKHIVVDAVPKLLGDRKASLFLTAATSFAVAVFLAYLFNAGLNYLDSPGVQFRTSTALGLPMKYVVIALPITLSVMILRFVQIGLEDLMVALGNYPREKLRVPESIEDMIKQEESAAAAPEAQAPVGADHEEPRP